jgi:hypothetical protein
MAELFFGRVDPENKQLLHQILFFDGVPINQRVNRQAGTRIVAAGPRVSGITGQVGSESGISGQGSLRKSPSGPRGSADHRAAVIRSIGIQLHQFVDQAIALGPVFPVSAPVNLTVEKRLICHFKRVVKR